MFNNLFYMTHIFVISNLQVEIWKARSTIDFMKIIIQKERIN